MYIVYKRVQHTFYFHCFRVLILYLINEIFSCSIICIIVLKCVINQKKITNTKIAFQSLLFLGLFNFNFLCVFQKKKFHLGTPVEFEIFGEILYLLWWSYPVFGMCFKTEKKKKKISNRLFFNYALYDGSFDFH